MMRDAVYQVHNNHTSTRYQVVSTSLIVVLFVANNYFEVNNTEYINRIFQEYHQHSLQR